MPPQALASPVERIKMARAIEITGEKERSLQAAAAAGAIPGAAKLCKCWTFDEHKLRRWIADKEREPCRRSLQADEDRGAKQRTRSSAARSGGRGFRSPAKSSEEAYQRAMSGLLGKEPRNGTIAK